MFFYDMIRANQPLMDGTKQAEEELQKHSITNHFGLSIPENLKDKVFQYLRENQPDAAYDCLYVYAVSVYEDDYRLSHPESVDQLKEFLDPMFARGYELALSGFHDDQAELADILHENEAKKQMGLSKDERQDILRAYHKKLSEMCNQFVSSILETVDSQIFAYQAETYRRLHNKLRRFDRKFSLPITVLQKMDFTDTELHDFALNNASSMFLTMYSISLGTLQGLMIDPNAKTLYSSALYNVWKDVVREFVEKSEVEKDDDEKPAIGKVSVIKKENQTALEVYALEQKLKDRRQS